jgi:hypothetical protein
MDRGRVALCRAVQSPVQEHWRWLGARLVREFGVTSCETLSAQQLLDSGAVTAFCYKVISTCFWWEEKFKMCFVMTTAGSKEGKLRCKKLMYTKVCSAMHCSAVQCSAVQCSAVQCDTELSLCSPRRRLCVSLSSTLSSTLLYSTLSSTLLYSTLSYTLLYSTLLLALLLALLYFTLLYSTLLYS